MGMRVNMILMKSNHIGPRVIMPNLNRVCFEHLYLHTDDKKESMPYYLLLPQVLNIRMFLHHYDYDMHFYRRSKRAVALLTFPPPGLFDIDENRRPRPSEDSSWHLQRHGVHGER